MWQLVAVYGTLKRGHGNHRLLEHLQKVKDDVIFASAFNGGFGFPYGQWENETENSIKVRCELYEVDKETERRLDMLEGVPFLYEKKYVKTKSGEEVLVYHSANPIETSLHSCRIEDDGTVERTKSLF